MKALGWRQITKGLKILEDKDKKVLIASITEIDDEIKHDFRECFSAICHGENLAAKDRGNYTYKKTIKEFNRRLGGAADNTQIGMIGELMVHLIIRKVWRDYITIIPYFNLEDRNIKKGFDSLVYSLSNGIWATEVKSGFEGGVSSAELDSKVNALLKIADTDISNKLNDQDEVERLWGLAMNGFQVACNGSNDEKLIIEELILDHQEAFTDAEGGANGHNVILSSVAFCETVDDISEEIPKTRHNEFEGKYANLFILAAKKSTTDLLIDFLLEEAGV